MGFIVKAIKSVVKTVVGVVSKVVGGVFGFLIGGSKSKKTTTPNTLSKTLDPEAYKKIILGKVAAPLDTRYWEVYGAKGERFVENINFAGHQINAILETYFENVLAFNAAGVAQGIYAGGVVARTTRLGAYNQTGFAVGGGAKWTATATNDGNAYASFDWLPDEKKLPNGIPTRVTQVCEGALVYDPRRDSTVAGGSGTHRINDRTTWAYATLDGNGQPIGRNNALQTLWYLLGWTVPIKNAGGAVIGEMLVCGRGVLPEDINIASFIAGANACEIAGYYTDLVLSTEDDHTSNEDAITCSGLIGRLIDPGGLWSYYANVDDTASIAVDLTDADILEGVAVNWDEYKGMSDQYNQVRGKFVNPSVNVLFQPFPYPMVRDAVYEANLGVKRAKTQDFRQVLDSTLAQRLARLLLNQGQYQGEFSAGFNYRSARAQAWSVVRYTSERFGWTKLFRVWRHDISTDSGITMLLKEIDPSIWAAGTVNPPLAPGAGLKYDPLQLIDPTNVTVTLAPLVGASGDKADGFRMSWDAPPTNVSRTEIRYRLVGTVYWKSAPPAERDVTAVLIGPELSGAIYEVAVRHISINEIPGNWIVPTTAPANGVGQFQMGVTGTVNYAAIIAAGGTATWTGITGAGKPQDNADVTLTHVSSGFTGQVAIATDGDAVARILAMRGDNLNRNGSFSEGATGYGLSPAASYVGNTGPAPYIIQFANGGTTGNSYAYGNNAAYVDIPYRRLYFSVLVFSSISTTLLFQPSFNDAAGAYAGSPSVSFTCAGNSAWTRYFGSVDVPAGANTGRWYFQRTGANGANLFITQITVSGVSPGAISGMDIYRTDGLTVLAQAEIRTLEGVASGFTGQGALSLLNAADWKTLITGAGKPANDAGTTNMFVVLGNYSSLVGNTLKKTGGTHGAYEGGIRGAGQDGSAFIACRPVTYDSTGALVTGGWTTNLVLDTSPTNLNPGAAKWWALVTDTGGTSSINLYKNNVNVASITIGAGLTANSELRLSYRGSFVVFTLDGVPPNSNFIQAEVSGVTFYPKIIDFYQTGNNTLAVRDIVYGSYPIQPMFGANGTVLRETGAAVTDALAITLLGIASGFTGQGSLSLLNSLDPSTSSLTAKGSIPATIPDNSFSYTSTTTTITVTWPNIVVYRIDGTSITISSGSQAITGLTASTSYKIYPYAVDGGGSSGTMSFVTGGSGSPAIAFTSASATAAASMYGRANIPMGSFFAATPASGGGGGGGGGSTCYHECNPMLTARGIVEAGNLLVGDMLPSPSGWQAIKEIRRKPAGMWVGVMCGDKADIVVPEHLFYKASGEGVRANELKLGDMLKSDGDHKEVIGLKLIYETADRIMTELESPHLYYGGSLQLLSHNPKP